MLQRPGASARAQERSGSMAFDPSIGRDRMVAVLASLQIGIEPAVLPLMVATGAVPLSGCGWVVGAGQAGMSAGAWLAWRTGAATGRRTAVAATATGIGVTLVLALANGLASVLILRLGLGIAMGMCLARAMAAAACERPQRAAGTILMGQQLLATVTMTLLAAISVRWGATAALAALVAVPLAMILLIGRAGPVRPACLQSTTVAATGTAHRLAIVPLTLLLGITAMTWSYVAAVGSALGFDDDGVAATVAATSLASTPAALAAALLLPRRAPATTALACALGIVAPLLLPQGSPFAVYVLAMVGFNAASAFAIARFAGWGLDTHDDRARRLVVLMQCLAMAAGAPLGAVAVEWGGFASLAVLAAGGGAASVLAAAAMRSGDQSYGSRPAALSFDRSLPTAVGPMLPSLRTAAISEAVKTVGFLPLAAGASWRAWFSRSARL